ncbi:hypothetical protein ACIQAC_02730 [Streptomyces sp. NPDC088387]|uniref:hypothetical protein n=1 Tax=Streptomyces sp. NPDC088387 TaxID=3365859 RepID=UPI0037FC168B
MTDSDAEATAPYTEASRARLVMAYEACELADLARAAVPIGERELDPDGTAREPGAMLADAARVLAAAQRFLEAAVVFERMGGADWQLVGRVLNVSPHSARVRFAMAEAAFREELRYPGRPGVSAAPDSAPASAPDSAPDLTLGGGPDGGPPHGAGAGTDRLWAHMVREPLETALDLDDWVLRHEDGESGLGSAPVSGGLVRREPRRRSEKHS